LSVSASVATGGAFVDAIGDRFGIHRVITPQGALPQAAERLDNDFLRTFESELLIDVETLNVDAASFRQMEDEAKAAGEPDLDAGIARRVLATVAARGKQHNPVTGSGGMLLGRVARIGTARAALVPGGDAARLGDRIATLVSLSLTPLRIDEVRAVRRESAQLDVRGQAVLFASGLYAVLPEDLPERVALAALDVAGAAPQTARLCADGDSVLVLGAGGKSGVLCCVEARRRVGDGGRVVGVEAHRPYAEDLRALGVCDAVIEIDARDPIAVRRAVLDATGGAEVDRAISCVNVEGAEMAAILCARQRGRIYFFSMTTSFTRAALGAEGVGCDVDMLIGNGYAQGHAEHTLALLRGHAGLRALFERRYG
jgi:L-erythro-3,5-diaminohexanoate dehydrogenase